MHHDDEIGEEVNEEEAEAVQAQVVMAILGPAAEELRFPGSQPVSLAASNIHLLKEHRYYVTWKADGTRYMLYISNMGTYLVDRSFKVRRVQMRWPTAAKPGHQPAFNPAILHNGTLLDGEMVVDEDKDTHKQIRRYLAYDMMQNMAKPMKLKEFKVHVHAQNGCCIAIAVVIPQYLENRTHACLLSKLQHRPHCVFVHDSSQVQCIQC